MELLKEKAQPEAEPGKGCVTSGLWQAFFISCAAVLVMLK